MITVLTALIILASFRNSSLQPKMNGWKSGTDEGEHDLWQHLI